MKTPSGGSQPGFGEAPDGYPVLEGYDIIDVIGRGGMGVVYEAFQTSTGRRVAVKLMLDRAAQTEAARRRFEREVELIARLDHPNIVGILDSGLHKGRYFYVMDFVEGRPLDGAFSPGVAPIRDSVGVIAKVARAVDYAHQRGVMHRDLKPSNIVVDDRAEPHLLDFGLAKAFDPNSLMNLRQSISEQGQVIGTLGYMPPEQARGAINEVSVRSDVYSLGAIAYELIAGALPCPIDGAMSLVFQRIESRDPDPPSKLRREASRDVDAILLKALEKDPSKRYPTAAHFAEDLERLLKLQPVSARRASPGERAVRWCRRNPAWTMSGVVAFLLLATLAGSVWWNAAEGRRRREAERISASFDAAMVAQMSKLDPDRNVGMAEAAKITLEQVEGLLDQAPRPAQEEAVWRERIADQQRKLGQYDNAEKNARRAVELRASMSERPSRELAQSLHVHGATLFDLRRFEEAEDLYRRALSMRRALARGRDDKDVADSMNHLAACLTRMRRTKEAEPLQREVREIRRRLFGEGSEEYAAAVNNLATLAYELGSYAEAESLYREALARLRELRGDDKKHRFIARSLSNIAGCMVAQGRLEGVEPLLLEAADISTQVIGPDSPEATRARLDLALLRLAQGRAADAEKEARRVVESRTIQLGERHQDTIDARIILGRALMLDGRMLDAQRELEAGLQGRLAAQPPIELFIAEAQLALGVCYAAMNRVEDASPLLSRAVGVLYSNGHSLNPRQQRFIAELDLTLSRVAQSEDQHDLRAMLHPRRDEPPNMP